MWLNKTPILWLAHVNMQQLIILMVTIMFKKLKSLFSKSKATNNNADDGTSVAKQAKDFEKLLKKTQKDHPIATQIMTWLDKQEWKYDHRFPNDDGHTHHLILGFTDRENDWTCVFRINEENQLVSIFGILEESVPVSHYTAILMEFAKVNLLVSFGGIEFDPNDGEVRTKIAFDVEFGGLSDKALGCYLQAVAGLTEVARSVMQAVMADDEPSQFAGDYVDLGDEVKTTINDEKQVFYLPTHTAQ